MIRELDTRVIFGNGGRVVWGFDDQAKHLVAVHDSQDRPVAVLKDLEPAEAALAFWHTFADPRVPDIFKREPDTLLVEAELDEDGPDDLSPQERRLLDDINAA